MIPIVKKESCQGLTLVELMIGLALSLLILGGSISVFISSKESFRLEEDLSVLQENFRYIADRLNKDLSMIGYMGCATPYTNNSQTLDAFVDGVGVTDIIQGTEGGADPDSITVSFALPESGIAVLDGIVTNKSDPLPVSKNQILYKALTDNFNAASFVAVTLLVGNCKNANLFLVTGVAEQAIDLDGDGTNDLTAGTIKHATGVTINGISNQTPELSRAYGDIDDETAMVFGMERVTYEIDTVSGVTGLYETRNGGTKKLLFDNVNNMQILYGIDSATSEDGNADHYVSWSGSIKVADITSLRITLTMVVSQANGADITRDYAFTVKLRDMGLDT